VRSKGFAPSAERELNIVRMPVKDGRLLILRAEVPRQRWDEAFGAAAPSEDDQLLLETVPPNRFDREDWKWPQSW
jgi:hypothetical protein